MDAKELKKLIADVEKQMRKAAADLNFEAAAELRDRMVDLKKHLLEIENGIAGTAESDGSNDGSNIEEIEHGKDSRVSKSGKKTGRRARKNAKT